jgi:hypothetical protein
MGTKTWEIYVNKDKHYVVTFLVKLCIILHSKIDDMQDHCVFRRGVPAAHKIYGVPRKINAATYFFLDRRICCVVLNNQRQCYCAQNIWRNCITNRECKFTGEITTSVHLWKNTRRWLREVRMGSELWAEFNWICEIIKKKLLYILYQSTWGLITHSLLFGIPEAVIFSKYLQYKC